MPTVLVVDDDRFIRRYLEIALTRAGYKVDLAEDGQSALDLAFKARPDIIILDVMMPRKTGWEVLRILRDYPQTQTIPVIVISAYLTSADASQRMRADAFFPKPLDLPKLKAKIEVLLADSAGIHKLGN